MTQTNTPPTYLVGPGTIFGTNTPANVNWQTAPTPLATTLFSHTDNIQPPFRTHTWVSNWLWANGSPKGADPDDQYAIGFDPNAKSWDVKQYYNQGPIYSQPLMYQFNGSSSLGNQGLILGCSGLELADDGYYSAIVNQTTFPLETKHLLSLKFGQLEQLWIYADPTSGDAFQGGPAYTPSAALLDDVGDFHARFLIPGPDDNHYYKLTVVQGSPLTWIQDVGDAYHTFQSLSTGPNTVWYNVGTDPNFSNSPWMNNLGCILVATYIQLTVDSGRKPEGGLNDIRSYFPYLVFYDKRTTEFQNASGGSDLPGYGQTRGLLKFNNPGPSVTNTYAIMAIPPIDVPVGSENPSISQQAFENIVILARSVAPYVFNVPIETQIQYQTFMNTAGSGSTVPSGRVRTTFSLTCDSAANPNPNPPEGSILCLMPHHYATYPYDGQGKSVLDEQSPLSALNYSQDQQLTFQSVRGPLKTYLGTGFTTQYIFNNFLPFMPTPKGLQKNPPDQSVAQTLWNLEQYRYDTYGGPNPNPKNGPYGTSWLINPVDTYNTGKALSALAKEMADVEMLLNSGYSGQSQNGFTPQTLLKNLQQGVEDAIALYFQATPSFTQNHNIPYFSRYDSDICSLLLYPAGGGPNALFPVPPSYLQGKDTTNPNLGPWDGYGTVTLLNDHFFHYGYLIYSAAQVALRDPNWANKWQPVVDQLAMDIAYNDDAQQSFGWSKVSGLTYPKLRYFDQWQGHGWASALLFGNQNGNNIESISEEINAWQALILWGTATGRPKITELGIYLYTTAVYASDTYWFDKLGLWRDPNLPTVAADKDDPTYYPAGTTYQDNTVHATNPGSVTTSTAAQLWGGMTKCSTFFGTMPVESTAIICVPANAGSGLYLGRNPDYVQSWFNAIADFSATLKDGKHQMAVPFGQLDSNCQFTDAQARSYASFMMRVKGLGGDVADALQWYTNNVASPGKCTFNNAAPFLDSADSWAETYVFLQALQDYGLPDWTWVADRPLAAVFSQSNTSTFVAFSPTKADTVTFSKLDGSKTYQLSVGANQMNQVTVEDSNGE